MPTYQITVTTGSGTNQATLTYTGTEANRIFNAWKQINGVPNATQADFVAQVALDTKKLFIRWCSQVETTHTTPAPPDITIS